MSDYVSREDHEDRVAQINAHRMDLQDRIEALSAEIARLRNALVTIARYDVGLQGHLEDFGDTLKSRLDYAEQMVRWRITAARAALGEQP